MIFITTDGDASGSDVHDAERVPPAVVVVAAAVVGGGGGGGDDNMTVDAVAALLAGTVMQLQY